MKKIRIAQIGIGHDHAADTYKSLGRLNDLFDVAGWCPVSDEAERNIPVCFPPEKRLTLEEVFDSPAWMPSLSKPMTGT